jgi:glycosyltransferase involved in cell wall biosynthesis
MAQVRCDLSIVTVVLNDKIGLEKTIKSVQNQESIQIEHIIVDGGSADGSASLAATNSSIPLESKKDGGIYPAMQRGADVASGKYILFCNAGDLIFGREYLAHSLEILKKVDGQWGYGPIIEYTQRDTYAWVPASVAPTSETIIARKDFVPFPSFIIKHELLHELGGFSRKYKIAGDFELICKAAIASDPVVFSEPIALFAAGGISYTQADLAWREEISIRREILQLNHLQIIIEKVKYLLRVTKWQIGKLLDRIHEYSFNSRISWREKRARKVPDKYISILK